MTEYAFHPEALNDLDEIWEFIAKDNVEAANRIVAQVLATCENLSRLPHQGHSRPELSSRPLRFVVVRDYLLAYAPDERPLWILAILHGKRNPRTLAAVLRERGSFPEDEAP